MRRIITIICLFGLFSFLISAQDVYRFRVYLKDKGNTNYSTKHPGDYLSTDAIKRRIRFNIPITESDLPISASYFNALEEKGARPICCSKWQSTIVVECQDSANIDQIKVLPMVKEVRWVWKGVYSVPEESRIERRLLSDELPWDNQYGFSESQIRMLNGIKLHEAGFKGEGMKVAVIDAGFENVDKIALFDSLQLLGTHNVHYPGHTVFIDDEHGTKVLSCLAAYMPGVMIGTAPMASYWLIESEDTSSEYPIEEDYWAAAVEFADSVGVDVVTSSLGYYKYDVKELSYKQENLDGKTSFISRSATMAADKGLLVFCSAGNEGNSEWEKITFPADSEMVVTVGAVTEEKKRSPFSSLGFSADHRIKPDVVALGSDCQVISSSGKLCQSNGTSFSTPILAGLGICLWQALPSLDNKAIIQLLQESSSQYKNPDGELGYGIPNVYKAYKKGLKNVRRNKR